MKIRPIVCILIFSFFGLESYSQEPLQQMNLRCDSVSKTYISISWDSIPNVIENRFFVDLPGFPPFLRDTVVGNFFELKELDINGPISYKIEIHTLAEPGFANREQILFCNRLICPPLTIDLHEEQAGYCFNQDSSYFIQPIVEIPVSAPGGSWGKGDFSFSGRGIDTAGRLNVDGFFPGIHQFDVSYEERGCSYSFKQPFRVSTPVPVEIECIYDDFLNLLGITWERRHVATSYQITINDSLVIVQDPIGYFYKPQFFGEEVDIKILPISDKGCKYEEAETTCTVAIWTNSMDTFEEEFVSVFPNPSTGIFEVFFRENSYGAKPKIEQIEVFALSGKKQKTVFPKGIPTEESKIDLSEFDAGVYFLKIHFDNKISFKKVIKR